MQSLRLAVCKYFHHSVQCGEALCVCARTYVCVCVCYSSNWCNKSCYSWEKITSISVLTCGNMMQLYKHIFSLTMSIVNSQRNKSFKTFVSHVVLVLSVYWQIAVLKSMCASFDEKNHCPHTGKKLSQWFLPQLPLLGLSLKTFSFNSSFVFVN